MAFPFNMKKMFQKASDLAASATDKGKEALSKAEDLMNKAEQKVDGIIIAVENKALEKLKERRNKK